MRNKIVLLLACIALLLVPNISGFTITANHSQFSNMTFNFPVEVINSANVTFYGVTFQEIVDVRDSTNILMTYNKFYDRLNVTNSGTVNARNSYWNTSYSPRGGNGACIDGDGTIINGTAEIVSWFVDSDLSSPNSSCHDLTPNISLVYPANNSEILYVENGNLVTSIYLNITTATSANCAYNDTLLPITALSTGTAFTSDGRNHSASFNLVDNRGNHTIQIYCENTLSASYTDQSQLNFYANPPPPSPARTFNGGGGGGTTRPEFGEIAPAENITTSVTEEKAAPILSITGLLSGVGDSLEKNKTITAIVMLVIVFGLIMLNYYIIARHDEKKRR